MSRWLLDLCYFVAAFVLAPIWLPRMLRAGKIRTDWRGRFGRVCPRSADSNRPRVLLHAVSVGEVNAVRQLISHLECDERRPEIIISATTDTGFARALALFGEKHAVVRYPFDASFAVSRFLRGVRPNVAALIELEVWPNFTAECARRGIPICVINGRLSERSAGRYRLIQPLVRSSFRRLTFAAVQNEQYARRFAAVGMPADRIRVTDTMKWDTAVIEDKVEGAAALAEAMGIDGARPLIVAGSTAPDEHALFHRAVRSDVQLLCAPRKPEWFDAAARDLPGCARRSRNDCGSATNRFLLDTIGDLRRAYALADLVIVGRTFTKLHGSDMMEPIALGKACILGPNVSNFQDVVDALVAGDGLVQTVAESLPRVIRQLLDNPSRRQALSANGRAVIRARQGASQRHGEMILELLDEAQCRSCSPGSP